MAYLCPHRRFLSITGFDAEKFLQGLTSNHMKILQEQDVIYSLFLNSKGRYKFDVFIWKLEENSFLIELHENLCEALKKWLKFYKLQAKLHIEEEDHYHIYISQKPEEGFVKDPRCPDLLYRKLCKGNKQDIQSHFDYETFRLKHLIVETEDLREEDTPIEVGLDDLNAISYEKGCYLGQEGINKAKHLSKRKRKICYFVSEKIFHVDEELFTTAGQSAGVVRHFHQGQGLVLLHINKEDELKKAYPEIQFFDQ